MRTTMTWERIDATVPVQGSQRCSFLFLPLSNKFIYFYIVFNGDVGVSGDHENSVKTHKNGESNFHLKRGSRPGPTKQSRAFPAERDHRGSLPVTSLSMPSWPACQCLCALLQHCIESLQVDQQSPLIGPFCVRQKHSLAAGGAPNALHSTACFSRQPTITSTTVTDTQPVVC